MELSTILKVDSYKSSHFGLYPKDMEELSAFIEPRKGDNIVFFGLQAYLEDLKPFTKADIDEAEEIFTAHGDPFNRPGWEYILNNYGGILPMEFQAIPEGVVTGAGVPHVQARALDKNVAWLTTYTETAALRAVWYPSAVASLSRATKAIIFKFLEETSDDPMAELPFKLHDFGARGVSSSESAQIGGAAHLVNFLGSDTIEAIPWIRRYYGERNPASSIPAAEHSTVMAWGKDGESESYRAALDAFPNLPLVAVVSDTYDIFNAARNIWGGLLKQRVERLSSSGRTLVIRPDSGDPVDTVLTLFMYLFDAFGYTRNKKGYKVLPKNVRLIWGDGIDMLGIARVLQAMKDKEISASNIVFGMGGGLLQKINRDTYSHAMKANEVVRAGKRFGVRKETPGKTSKMGRQAVVVGASGEYEARPEKGAKGNLLATVWNTGKFGKKVTFSEVRERAKLTILDKARAVA